MSKDEVKEAVFITADKIQVEDTLSDDKIIEDALETAVTVIDESNHSLTDSDILNPQISMNDKLVVATEVANHLRDVLEKQHLVVRLNKSDKEGGYVLVEGWNTLGTMLGVTPVTEKVEPFTPLRRKSKKVEPFGYKATVSLYQNGNKLCTAEAVADNNGFQTDEFAIYSMAQTRALGKCYRMALSWIIKLAGYEPTPFEEMPQSEKKKYRKGGKIID